jgi:hypothetical protein
LGDVAFLGSQISLGKKPCVLDFGIEHFFKKTLLFNSDAEIVSPLSSNTMMPTLPKGSPCGESKEQN